MPGCFQGPRAGSGAWDGTQISVGMSDIPETPTSRKAQELHIGNRMLRLLTPDTLAVTCLVSLSDLPSLLPNQRVCSSGATWYCSRWKAVHGTDLQAFEVILHVALAHPDGSH